MPRVEETARYLLVARSPDSAQNARARVENALSVLGDRTFAGLTVTFADGPPPPVPRVGTGGERFAALVSVVGLRADVDALEHAFAQRGLLVSVYRAETATPVAYERTWPEGEVSPGLVQLTFLRRKPGMDDEAFVEAWHGVHTPLAMEIHPLWRYTRHHVREVVTEGATPFEGIVELHFRHDEDVTDPLRFYGGDAENAKRIARDVRSWIDFGTIEVVHGREHVLRDH
jgi:uncharacterized protein (TIGR02118 family)